MSAAACNFETALPVEAMHPRMRADAGSNSPRLGIHVYIIARVGQRGKLGRAGATRAFFYRANLWYNASNYGKGK